MENISVPKSIPGGLVLNGSYEFVPSSLHPLADIFIGVYMALSREYNTFKITILLKNKMLQWQR